MDTFEVLLNELESEILKAKKATFSQSDIIMNKGYLQELIARMRNSFPIVFSEAKQIKENEGQIVNNANAYAERIINEANEEAAKILSESEIIKRAQEDANAMRTEAEENYKRADYETRAMSYQILDGVEKILADSINLINDKKRQLIQ